MDHYTQPEIGANSARDGLRAAVVVAILVGALVALSIGGSALWRPPPLPDTALELGRAELVSFSDAGPNETIPRVLEFVRPTVGFLIVNTENDDDPRRILRSGSGFVVHEAGFMITNAHVVEDATEVTVTFANGEEYDAEVYGVHPATDLAVVKIDADVPLPVAALGDSDSLHVGEFVLALGAPFGYQESATSGIVSGLHRSGLGIARYEDFIITDAPINRGNSGGPLVNLRGEVVGINTAIIADGDSHPGTGTFAGVGFAIPMNVARVVARSLIGDGGLAEAPPARVVGAAPAASPENEAGLAADRTGMPMGQGLEAASAAVVSVRAFDAAGVEISAGSGFNVQGGEEQLVITNAHVVHDAERVEVTFAGGPPLVGEVIQRAGIDIVVIRLGGGPYPYLEVGSASRLSVDAPIHALGFRDSGRVAQLAGVVTRLDAHLSSLPGTPLIETSAATVPGDSGGPLLAAAGMAVGVFVARALVGEGGVPRSYAIPFDEVIRVIEFATAQPNASSFERGFAALLGGPGPLVVGDVDPGGAAARAGLRRLDRILAADGEPLDSFDRQQAWLNSLDVLAPGTQLTLTVQRRVDETSLDFRTMSIVYTVPTRSP